MTRSDGCVFCAISAGRAEASVVYEDDDVIAFMDLGPINDGHVLVAPRDHRAGLADLTPELSAAMIELARRIAGVLRDGEVGADGVNLMLSDGEAAGQEVMHSHLHVVPRHRGDSLQITADWSRPTRGALDNRARRLREELESRS